MSPPRIWFITGASSGFGRTMTEHVLKSGDIAVATLRNAEAIADLTSQYSADRLLVLEVDVKSKQDIRDAFAKSKEAFSRIDIVLNNIRCPIVSEVESASDRDAGDLPDVNFWGAVNVTKQAVKFLREGNPPGVGGWLLQVSSVRGHETAPDSGFYRASSTKCGEHLEAVSESLAQEVDPTWNIKVTIVESGPCITKALDDDVVYSCSDPTMPTAISAQHLNPDGDTTKGVTAVYRRHVESPNRQKLPMVNANLTSTNLSSNKD